MEVSCSSVFIISVVFSDKGGGGEGLLRASVNYSADLLAVSLLIGLVILCWSWKTLLCYLCVRLPFWFRILSQVFSLFLLFFRIKG